ncbi:cytochrome P450 6k1-like [Nylanderia fulva]|uniref:cytochrome P450 6k1-like n=1 Tax=Nylanderia fulva TaxID=613905 RepID=UPI0010FAD3D2|nr:cytochrome P450 6k1-like [Nylanderia fulva]
MAFITSYWTLDSLIILIVSIIIAYFYMTRKFKYWKQRGVAEISPTPFTGNFTECALMKKAPGLLLHELHEQAKGEPYVGLFMFDKPFLLIRDPEVIKHILVKNFNHFCNRYFIPNETDRLGYANLFFVNNPVWKMLKLKMTQAFTPNKLRKMVNLIDECAKNLVNYLDSMDLGDDGKIINVKELCAKFTTDVIGSTAFGLNTNSFKHPDAEFCRYGSMMFSGPVRSFEISMTVFMPTLSRLFGVTFFSKPIDAFFRKVFWETMAERRESGETRNDILDILIKLKDEHGDEDIEGFKFDGDELLAQAGIFFAAGYETSSTTMYFALYELALNLEVQNRVREEIFDTLIECDGKITYEMIMSLSYLEMVFLEVLRMYPPLEYLQRATTEAYNMPNSNLVLEKDTPIFISIRGLHYDPNHFPNPDKFDPERFNEENRRKRPMCVHLPFGDGPRGCIGSRMAFVEMKLAFIKFLLNFEVTPCEKTLIPMKLDPMSIMTTPIGDAMHLNVRKINTGEELKIALHKADRRRSSVFRLIYNNVAQYISDRF